MADNQSNKPNLILTITGIIFGGLTFIFFVILVFLSISGKIFLDNTRYLIIFVLSIGMAFAFLAIGGSVTANLKLFPKIIINTSGGIGVFFIVLIVGCYVYVNNYLPKEIPVTEIQKISNNKTFLENFKQFYEVEGNKYNLISSLDKEEAKKIFQAPGHAKLIKPKIAFDVSKADNHPRLDWTFPEDNLIYGYNGFIILRNINKKINYDLINDLQYTENKIIEDDLKVLKILDKDINTYEDTNATGSNNYYYKLFVTGIKDNKTFYYIPGFMDNVIINKEDDPGNNDPGIDNYKVSIKNIKGEVLKVKNIFNKEGISVELYWTILARLPDGKEIILNKRKKENFERYTNNKRFLNKRVFINPNNSMMLEWPKINGTEFEIIVDIKDLDYKSLDGVDVEDTINAQGGEQIVFDKRFTYNVTDPSLSIKYVYDNFNMQKDPTTTLIQLEWQIQKEN